MSPFKSALMTLHIQSSLFSKGSHFYAMTCELLQLMANDVLRQILAENQKTPYFSLIVDETKHVTTTEQVSACVRYLQSDLRVGEYFLGWYKVNSTMANVRLKSFLTRMRYSNI
jgi:hypothetical protein